MSARRVWTRLQRLAALAVVAACLIGAGIPLSSYLVNQGTFAPLGFGAVVFASDANKTASATDYAGRSLYVTSSTSLTASRKLIVPLEQGISYEVYNATTGGFAITFGGSTGAVATIANGTLAVVNCPDGANFYSVSGGGGSTFDPTNPGPIGGSDAGAGTFTDLIATSSATFSSSLGFANGTARFFGNGSVVYSSDADKDISGIPNAYTSPVLEITATGGGLTAARNLTVPFGGPWWVLNRTTQTINIGGSSGSRVGVPAGYAMSVVSNTGNFFGVLPINLASSAFVTGTLALGSGGTGVTSAGTSGNVLRSNGSVWASSAIQSGDLTSALASPPAIGGTTPAAGTFSTITGRSGTRYRDAGGSTVEFPSECGGVGTTTNGPVDSCTFLATFTDATTWVNLMPTGFLIANRTSATFDLEYSITDQTDAPDAGPVDLQVGQFRFTATASNGGGITVFDEIGGSASSSSLTIAAAPTSKSYISGVAGAVVPACRVVVTGSYLQPQCQGRASKTDVGQFTMQNARGLQ